MEFIVPSGARGGGLKRLVLKRAHLAGPSRPPAHELNTRACETLDWQIPGQALNKRLVATAG